jgi:ubiquinol-cytochrome c reductase cytochrome b subunit
MVTPIPLEPVWYFMPFYMMLRSVPSFLGTQVWGVLVMGGAVLILFGLPWFDKSPVKSIRYRPMLHKVMIALFAITFFLLGYFVTRPGTDALTWTARILTLFYFLFFLTMPVWSRMGTFKAVPDRVTTHD